jgi:nicotinate phosphoribosyltransferase
VGRVQSGIPNFICVALALSEIGYKVSFTPWTFPAWLSRKVFALMSLVVPRKPLGIRLDSGDLAYLSKEARAMFAAADKVFPFANLATNCRIVASNDINEAVLMSLNDQGHSIDTFGIGTNLVTCQAQPALGMVYKLVEINGKPRMKLSQEVTKVRYG